MAALAIGLLGGLGTFIAGTLPWAISASQKPSDASSNLINKLTQRIGLSDTIYSVESEEDKIIKDLDKKYIEMEDILRRVVHTEYMVTSYLPEALIRVLNDSSIIKIEDVYTHIDAIKADARKKRFVFEDFAGFLRYREPYKRVVKNFLNLFDRLRKLKEQIRKIYDEQASNANKSLTNKYGETDPELKKIKGDDFPIFIKSEMGVLYNEFLQGFDDYRSYKDRISIIYQNIQGKTLDELDVLSVAKTDISKYTGQSVGTLLWTTEQNIEEAQKLLDEMNAIKFTYLNCLKNISTTVESWQNQLRSNKGPVISQVKLIIGSEKEIADSLIKELSTEISKISEIESDFSKIKAEDKLNDAKIAYEDVKTRKKKFDRINENISDIHARMNGYVSTVAASGEGSITFIPCSLKPGVAPMITSTGPSAPSGPSGPSVSGVGARASRFAMEASPGNDIVKKLQVLDFKEQTDKDGAESLMETFRDIIKQDIPKYVDEETRKYKNITIINSILSANKDLFLEPNNSIYGSENIRNPLEQINSLVGKTKQN